VAKKNIREALLKRLAEFDNDQKKAFTGKNSIDKNPIYIDQHQSYKVPDKVKIVWIETDYTIRKDITPDLFKDSKKNDDFENRIKNIYDKSIQTALIKHYNKIKEEIKLFNSTVEKEKDKKKVLDVAFSNLTENPIWLNEEKGISIKRVTISGISNAVSLRDKKDHNGNLILNNEGNKIAVDFVNTGNNHHVAIYKDEKGNLQEKVVSFYEAVIRVDLGLPVIIKNPAEALDIAISKELIHPAIENLPPKEWQFLFTMKQNECFVFPNEKTGFNPQETDSLNPENYHLISPNLFRVQKIATKDYTFRHHLQTTIDIKNETKNITWKRLGINGIENLVKVRINHLGKIVKIGE
jgi:CRISPR-associated endonuclease Csn1